jgi:UDP-GlcNAc:undecaprenyl-phosphate GlcNAc-1-phosphate transferase
VTTCLVAFILALVVAALTTPFVVHTARRLRVVDRPDDYRKVHQGEVPLLGGTGIFVAFFVPVAILYFVWQNPVADLLRSQPRMLLGLVLGGGVALALGATDDVFDLRPRWKLLLQTSAALVACLAGFRIDGVSIPWGGSVQLGILAWPVTIFWFLGCMNAVNLLDGLDGLATGVCLLVGLTLFMVSMLFQNTLSMLLMACFSGAALGFLVFNFHPARIFLGDSGSMLLGYLLAALALVSSRKAETVVALIVPAVALGIPIFDTTLTIVRRWSRKLPISTADRQHIHHILLGMGLSHKRVVLVMYLLCLLLGGAALLISVGRSEITLVVLGSLLILAIVWARILGGIRFLDFWYRLSTGWRERDRVNAAHLALQKAVAHMRHAKTQREVWRALRTLLEVLAFDGAVLRLGADTSAPDREWVWTRHPQRPAAGNPTRDYWRAHLTLRCGGETLGVLELDKDVGREGLEVEVPEIVERLRPELATELGRTALNAPGEEPRGEAVATGSQDAG